ncbi:MAG: hypothetical protein JW821_06795, partial [Deltaproteobacteria bacterium]|nr:hypothetical protein [Deltaproteobacteria bacterium]
RTDPDYRPLYEKAGASVGKLFAGETVPGPEVIARLILEAVAGEQPRISYSGGFMSEELLGQRRRLDDDGFDRYFSELTGLKDLKV